jgi:hypothetical protein
MDEQRAALLADIDNWIAGARTLAETLEANGRAVDEGRVMLEDGSRLVDAIATMRTTKRFLNMSAALTDFEVARFRLRSSLINTALTEGLTKEQLVETLGVPADLAGKVLAELDTEPGTPRP